jgi:tetratricopeptide (TPR) repeat protein
MAATTTPETDGEAMTWEQYHEAGRRRFAEGDAAGAEEAFRGAVAEAERSGAEPLQLASSLSSLGQLKYQQKDYARAEDCFRRALELRDEALGSDHPTVISSINNLAALYVARGALDEAEPLLQRAMAVTIKRVEATQADLAVNLNNLVRLYVKRGDYARAEPLLTQLLALKRPLGPEHPEVAAVLVTLAKLRQSMGQPDAAERLWRRVLAVRERTLAPSDPMIAATLEGLADSCGAQDKRGDEIELRERALAVREAALGADHPSLAAARARLAELRPVTGPASPSSTMPGGRRSNGVHAVVEAQVAPSPATGFGGMAIMSSSVPSSDSMVARRSGPSVRPAPAAESTPAGSSAVEPLRATPIVDLYGNISPTPAVVPAVVPAVERARSSAPVPAARTSSGVSAAARTSGGVSAAARTSGGVSAAARTSGGVSARTSAPRPAADDDVTWVDPAYVTTGSEDPESTAGIESDASDGQAAGWRADVGDPALRRGGFAGRDRGAGEDGEGSGHLKMIGIAVAATIMCIAVGVAVFGHSSGPSTPAATSAPASIAPAAPAAPAGRAVREAPATALSSGASATTTSASPPALVKAAGAPSVTVREAPALPPVKTAGASAAARPAKPAPPAAGAAPSAVDIAPPVPSVNLDAATRSIDEATKAKAQKTENPTPF